ERLRGDRAPVDGDTAQLPALDDRHAPLFFFKQKTAYELGLGIPAEPLFRSDCYQYFCVPEYGTANGRLHFHAVHFMRTLPTGSVDPNFGRRVRNRRQLNSLQNTWPYGYSMPIAVRYT